MLVYYIRLNFNQLILIQYLAGVCEEYITKNSEAKLQLEDWKLESNPEDYKVNDNFFKRHFKQVI